MQAKLALLLLITLSCAPQLLADCDSTFDFRHHVQPIFVKNSKYTVQENGEICCPLNYEDSECIPADEMKCCCPHGLVSEPCHHCKTCAKGPGEMCGGLYGAIGKCAKGLRCTADRDKFIHGLNITGICVGDGRGEAVCMCVCLYKWQYVRCAVYKCTHKSKCPKQWYTVCQCSYLHNLHDVFVGDLIALLCLPLLILNAILHNSLIRTLSPGLLIKPLQDVIKSHAKKLLAS